MMTNQPGETTDGRPTACPIAIASGKGGVGKSSLSVNIGLALARRGRRVCILDADTGLANVNILLGLAPRYGLEHVLLSDRNLDDVLLTTSHGLCLVPGASGVPACARLDDAQQRRLAQALSAIEARFDYLLVDTAAGIAPDTLDFIRASSHTLLVITPEPTSLTDAFSLVKLLKGRGHSGRFHVVVNLCAGARQAREVYYRFAGAVDKYIGVTVSYLGCLPRDESLRAAVAMQSPVALLSGQDPSSRRFFQLAESLEKVVARTPVDRRFSAYWAGGAEEQPAEKEAALSSVVVDRPVAEQADPGAERGPRDQPFTGSPGQESGSSGNAMHVYDESRFGPQRHLLDLLRAHPGEPLEALLHRVADRQAG